MGSNYISDGVPSGGEKNLKANWDLSTPDKRRHEQFDNEAGPSILKNGKKNKNGYFDVEISKKDRLTHDTYYYKLKFPNKEWISGLPAGSAIQLAAPDPEDPSKIIERYYSVISPVN